MGFLRRKFTKIILLSLLAILLIFGSSNNLLAQMSDDQVKAAILVKMIDYIEWTAKPETVNVMVYGDSGIYGQLSSLEKAGTKFHEGTWSNRKPQSVISIAVIGKSLDSKTRQEIIAESKRSGYLVIDASEGDNETSDINLAISNSRVVFDINLESLEKKKISISSKLLKLARTVKKGGDAK